MQFMDNDNTKVMDNEINNVEIWNFMWILLTGLIAIFCNNCMDWWYSEQIIDFKLAE